VLLDLHMPGIDGFALLEQLTALDGTGVGVPVIVLTADVTEQTKRRALSMGARDFLTKPFDQVELLLRVRNVLHIEHLQERLHEHNMTLEARVAKRTHDLEEARLEMLDRLALAAEYRDDGTQEHAWRIARTSGMIARGLGLPPDRVELIRRASSLHDIGKIGIPDAILPFIGSDASRRRRFFAVTNRAATMNNAKLVLRYNAAFPSNPVTEAAAPQPSYDAFYVLAYSTYALGDSPITGLSLSHSIESLLPPGRGIDVGPAQIGEAFEVLRSGRRIDLSGAIGSLDFDPKTGDAPIDYAIVCPGVDDHGRASPDVDSHLFYDAREKKLVGTMACP